MDVPKIDKEFAKLHRQQTDSEYGLLKEDIKLNGLLDPILVWDEENAVIDGHHRVRACGELEIKPRYVYKSFPDRDSVIFFIKLHQASRRNVTPEEYAMNLLSLRDSCSKSPKSANLHPPSLKEITKICGLSERTVKKLSVINKKGGKRVKDAVKDGKKSVDKAYTEAKEKDSTKTSSKSSKSELNNDKSQKTEDNASKSDKNAKKGQKTSKNDENDQNTDISKLSPHMPPQLDDNERICVICRGTGKIKIQKIDLTETEWKCPTCGMKHVHELENVKKCKGCGEPRGV